MQKIFQQYGGVITAAIAIVALIGIVAMLVGGPTGGLMGNAFTQVVDNTANKADEKLDGIDNVIMLDGNNTVVNTSAFVPLSFRSSAPFEDFKEVRVDGEVVDGSNYTVTSGSTIVTFNTEYTQVLSTGSHKVEIISESGSTEGNFNINASNVIPEGGTYYVGVNPSNTGDYSGKKATYKAGDEFPSSVTTGDVYVYGDYEYRYNQYFSYPTWKTNEAQNGWGVRVIDDTKSSYGEILTSINCANVTTMNKTFYYCKNFTDIKSVLFPNNVKDMSLAFGYCDKLEVAPNLSNCTKLTNIYQTFTNCSSLKTYDGSSDADGDFSNYVIPNSVTNMGSTFEKCSSLKSAPAIPNNVTDMLSTFAYCTALEDVSKIVLPSTLTKMRFTFTGCTALTTAPIIPSGVNDMYCTFNGCSSLKTYVGSTDADGDFSNYVIPNSVTNMTSTFAKCINITTAPVIPNSVTIANSTFNGCTQLSGSVSIPCSATTSTATLKDTSATINNYHYEGCGH